MEGGEGEQVGGVQAKLKEESMYIYVIIIHAQVIQNTRDYNEQG